MRRNVLAATPFFLLAGIFFLLAGLAVWYVSRRSPESQPALSEVPLSENDQTLAPESRVAVTYLCNEGKTIEAVYYEESRPHDPREPAQRSAEATTHSSRDRRETPVETSDSSDGATSSPQVYPGTRATSSRETQPDGVGQMPPVPHGRVHLVLSDGREMTLAQTISASGIRYSDGDPSIAGSESFVFWSKGNGALVLEHNVEKSYIGCIAIAPDPGGLSGTFANSSEGYSVRYPSGWEIEPNYTYELRPGASIHGVKFRVPDSLAAGTNLSADSGISIEAIYGIDLPKSEDGPECSAEAFLLSPQTVREKTIDGVDYFVASSTEPAAGNRYEEIVYVVKGTEPCLAVRYFLHYGVLENYEGGTVQPFDRESLLATFDAIRGTLTIAP